MKIASVFFLLCLGSCVGVIGSEDDGNTVTRQTQPLLAVPAAYRDWPTFLTGIQRTDSGQVRDIYVNDVGATAQQGQPFPEGTVMVMDLFAARTGSDGTALTNDDGTLMKGNLLKIFLMGKKTGWESFAPSGMSNGDWLYFAYQPDAVTQTTDSIPGCFACHLPLGESKDWVQRYDEYFSDRHPD